MSKKLEVVLPPIDADPEEVVNALFRNHEVVDLTKKQQNEIVKTDKGENDA